MTAWLRLGDGHGPAVRRPAFWTVAGASAVAAGDPSVGRLDGAAGRDPGATSAAGARTSQIGATLALESIRSVAGGTGNTAVGVPAAAHTTGKRPRSGSITTRSGRAWPMGGMPPMVKPVSSRASFALARRTSGSPVTAARRARSTRLGPDTRHRMGSSAPPSAGATKTSDFTICPSSASTAPAASPAVCVDSVNTRTSRVTPLRAAASTTRWIGPDTGVRARRRVYMRPVAGEPVPAG